MSRRSSPVTVNGATKSNPSTSGKITSSSASSTPQRSSEEPKHKDPKKDSISGAQNTNSHDDLADILNSLSELQLTDSLPGNNVSEQGNLSPNTEKRTYFTAKKVAPTLPGIYRFYRTGEDVEAYIGHSKNIRKRLRNHAYGKQHVDEFLRAEGYLYVEVKTEVSPTKDDARNLEKSHLIAFKEKHGRLPEFNRRM